MCRSSSSQGSVSKDGTAAGAAAAIFALPATPAQPIKQEQMQDVYVIGTGQVPVNNDSDARLTQMGAQAVRLALADAAVEAKDVDALFVGNMLAGILNQQQQLGSLIADYAGLDGIEAYSIEAACASGGAAIRQGYARIASGLDDIIVVCGVESMTHAPNETVTRALASATDWELEGSRGESFITLNATLMRNYMQRYGVGAEAFAPFAVNAHRNALNNPHAFLRKDVNTDRYLGSRMVADPLRLFDISPICNGAAAIVLANADVARAAHAAGKPRISIAASAVATDAPALSRRADPFRFTAVEKSTQAALKQAGITHDAVDFFELHDAYTIMAVLCLESAGFAAPGTGTRLGLEGRIQPDGDLPISMCGGLKARGHPVGATGVYQFVESCEQLAPRGTRNGHNGSCHNGHAHNGHAHNGNHGLTTARHHETALLQNIGGIASTVVTHVLRREA
jgi:acetyl-CoA C-acetyltransferase